MGHRTYRFSVESSAEPDRLMAAATDFTERRLHFWPTISAKRYRVHSVSARDAEVTEGDGPVWTRSRYTWGRNVVRSTILESNAAAPGDTWEMTLSPREGGGSRVDIVIDHHWHGLGLLGQLLAGVLGQERFFVRDMRETVRRVEADAEAGPVALGNGAASRP